MKNLFFIAGIAAQLCLLHLPAPAMPPTDEQPDTSSALTPLVITGTLISAGAIGIAYYRHHQKEALRKQEEARKQEAYDYCIHCLHDAKRTTLKWAELATKNPETPPVQVWTLRRIRRLFCPCSFSRNLALEDENRHLEHYIENLTINCPADPLYVKKLPWLKTDRTSNKRIPNQSTLKTILDFYDTLRETVSTRHRATSNALTNALP